jgi:phosphatidylserine/phosphatidylglycerophosphate/cardiolipin synthase-like enzyme
MATKNSTRKTTSKIMLVTDQDYLPSLLKLLSIAKSKIDIMSFSFAIGSAGGKYSYNGAPFKIAATIKEIKKKKGDKIRIRFFTEGFRETVDRNKITADYLEAAGVEVVYGATHAKGFCVDERYVLFGSTNLTNQSIQKNHEANLFIDDKKVAREFTRYFDHLWNGGSHGEINLKAPMLPDGEFKDTLIDMINRSRKTIDFSIYFFNHREIEKALIEASKKGVNVRGFIHQHSSFALSYIRANRATARRLKNSGVTNIHFGPPYTFSHSKYLVIDGKELILGSGNWLEEDIYIHPQLHIHLKNATVARKLISHLDYQIEKYSAREHL